jgi:hypothetical protein
MKLNTAQVARTMSQLRVEALPEDHPLVPQLNRIFGDHTYFLDGSGLNILEPAAAALEVRRRALARLECWSMSQTGPTPIRPSSKSTSRI